MVSALAQFKLICKNNIIYQKCYCQYLIKYVTVITEIYRLLLHKFYLGVSAKYQL